MTRTNKLPITIAIALFLIFLAGGYSGSYYFSWTGFGDYAPPPGVKERGKTFWDWLDLLIIPAVLAGGALWLNRREREAEQVLADQRAKAEHAAAEERRREDTLQKYLDTMSELILDRGLRESQPGDAVRDIARARTLSVLRVLDSDRNRTVVQFLREAELFEAGEAAIVNLANSTLERVELERINFQEADLRGINLFGADLHWASLNGVKLSGAILIGTNLSGASLRGGDLSETHLVEANLSQADLRRTNLSRTLLGTANLSGAKLYGVNLRKAILTRANLNGADLSGSVLDEITLTGATYDTTTQWPPGFDPAAAGAILVKTDPPPEDKIDNPD
ncbi:MAG TPA: pentapeptide repeat-containing protein [Anaerolineae bacterium]